MADKKYSIEDLFNIVHRALMPYYDNETVNISYEKNDVEETSNVPTLEFIMNSIGHELADSWTSTKEEAVEGMHKGLDGYGYYGEFTFDIDTSSIGKIPSRGGSRRKLRKSRKTRKSSR